MPREAWRAKAISGLRTYQSSVASARPTKSADALPGIEAVLVEVDCEGLVGSGYALCSDAAQSAVIRSTLVSLGAALRGLDPSCVQSSWSRMWPAIATSGRSGVAAPALAALDTALWDLHAQFTGLPLFRLLGADTAHVPLYVTAGRSSQSAAEVLEEAVKYRDQGFKYVKIDVGSQPWRRDVERIRTLRTGLGDSVQILVDAHQGWTARGAIEAACALADLDVYWLQRPLAAKDLAVSAQVAATSPVPIAAGEDLYGVSGFKAFFQARAAQVVTPDLMRCGGPTGVMQVMRLAEAHRMACSAGILTEVSAHLMTLAEPRLPIEYLPGLNGAMFDEAAEISDGRVTLSERPGLGITFSEQRKRGGDR